MQYHVILDRVITTFDRICCSASVVIPHLTPLLLSYINILRPRKNGRPFADDTFKRSFLNENIRISIEISLKFVSKVPIDNIPALVLIMAWRRPGDKPLSEPMMVSLPTHICVTRPQWVKTGSWWHRVSQMVPREVTLNYLDKQTGIKPQFKWKVFFFWWCVRIDNTWESLSHPGILFTKRTNVLPHDLAKPRSREIQVYTFQISLEFDAALPRCLSNFRAIWSS